jgi:hypothetical protein
MRATTCGEFGTNAAASYYAMAQPNETTLWTCPQGIRCVLLPYDEARYQLKLVRETGTIKADLFAGHANAVTASRRWREEIDLPREEWPPSKLNRREEGVAPGD